MARIRTVKPEFWSDEQVMECSPLARLMFIGIWNFCDDGGNHPLSERTIKALIFPGDSFDSTSIRRLLAELSENALLRFYECSGKAYLNVKGWRHQKIDKPTIKYPAFDDGIEVYARDLWPTGHVVGEHSTSTRRALDEASPPEGKGKGKVEDQDQKHSAPAEKPKAVTDSDMVEAFSVFWKLYPKKVSKADAVKAWGKIKKDLVPTIMLALANHVVCEQWVKDEGKFVPNAATWLNKQKWEDEVKPYVAGRTNTGTSGQSRPSLVDQVRAANAHHLVDEPPAIDPRDWPEFDSIREIDGAVVGADD